MDQDVAPQERPTTEDMIGRYRRSFSWAVASCHWDTVRDLLAPPGDQWLSWRDVAEALVAAIAESEHAWERVYEAETEV